MVSELRMNNNRVFSLVVVFLVRRNRFGVHQQRVEVKQGSTSTPSTGVAVTRQTDATAECLLDQVMGRSSSLVLFSLPMREWQLVRLATVRFLKHSPSRVLVCLSTYLGQFLPSSHPNAAHSSHTGSTLLLAPRQPCFPHPVPRCSPRLASLSVGFTACTTAPAPGWHSQDSTAVAMRRQSYCMLSGGDSARCSGVSAADIALSLRCRRVPRCVRAYAAAAARGRGNAGTWVSEMWLGGGVSATSRIGFGRGRALRHKGLRLAGSPSASRLSSTGVLSML